MTEPRVYAAALSLLLAGCGGLTSIAPTMPSPALTSSAAVPAPSSSPSHSVGPDVPSGLVPTERVITSAVAPLALYSAPCYVERYACEKYRFTMNRSGAVQVMLSWEGGARAMLIQLYRAGAGLVHEDVAPRDGAPTITFRRVDIEPMEYELRVVNMEPQVTHPFTLTLTTWQ